MEKKEREREKFREIEYKLIHRTETGIDKRIKSLSAGRKVSSFSNGRKKGEKKMARGYRRM